MKIVKIIIINLLLITTVIIIFESVLILLKKNKIDCHYVLCNINIKYKDFDNNLIYYYKDKYGLRGRYKELSDIDITLVGGSTVDERYLNLEDTTAEQLEILFNLNRKKKIDVINAGIDGQSTIGHIWNFNKWFNYLPNFKSKYFIFIIGLNEQYNNDIYNNIEKNDFLFKSKKFIINNDLLLYKIYKKITFAEDKVRAIGHIKRAANYMPIINNNINNFKNYKNDQIINNLIKLKNHSQSIGSQPIFVTQRSLRWKKQDNIIMSIDNYDYYSYEKKVSETIINFCKENKIICVNLFEEFSLTESDTYDLVHLNKIGAKKQALIIFNNIKNISF